MSKEHKDSNLTWEEQLSIYGELSKSDVELLVKEVIDTPEIESLKDKIADLESQLDAEQDENYSLSKGLMETENKYTALLQAYADATKHLK